MSRKILIVEDEPTISDAIRFSLLQEGFQPEVVSTLAAAREIIDKGECGLIVLDIGLPDGNGLDFCRELRKTRGTPVIFLTARGEEIDRIVGLELGADDYIVKPFSSRELAARVKAVLRRGEGEKVRQAAPGLDLLDEAYDFAFNGTPLKLTRYEFRLLATLYRAPGRVLTREQLMNAGWEDPQMSLERTVDSHVKSLRSKLRLAGGDPDVIVTHRGIGYSLIRAA